MEVKIGKRERGRREHIFTGDEAVVSRIWMPGSKYDGMVERIQPLKNTETSGTITIIRGERSTKAVQMKSLVSDNPLYHLIKFYAARLARGRFPENFIDIEELRYIKRGKEVASAMYSQFIEDSTNEREARKRAMEKYYNFRKRGNDDEAEEFKITDENEHREKRPQLRILIERFEEEGFVIVHPCANYQVDKSGNVVFFELEAINIKKMGIRNATELLLTSLIESAETIQTVRGEIKVNKAKERKINGSIERKMRSREFFRGLVSWIGIKSILTETNPRAIKIGEFELEEIENPVRNWVERIGNKEKIRRIDEFSQEVDKMIRKIVHPNEVFDFSIGPV